MTRKLFRVGIAWRLLIALILVLCLIPICSSPAAALSIDDYFEISYEPVEFSKTEIHGGEVFYATVKGTATCIQDLPLPVSEAWVTSLIIATHQVSGAKVTLNPSYTVTIAPFPSYEGDTAQMEQTIPLQFAAQSETGGYDIVGELIEAKVNTLIGWFTVTPYLPPSQTMGSVIYVAPDEGGGGELAPPGKTSLSGKIDWQGIMTQSFIAKSFDKLCKLTIEKRTTALTGYNTPLRWVGMYKMISPPDPPEDAHVIGVMYDFQPSGATFNPPITLEYSYDPDDIPEAVNEEDLVIAYYDVDTGKWVELECVVDTEANTIIAKVSHFTTFAVFGYEVVVPPVIPPIPAAFSLSSLSIFPDEVDIGETVNISILVTNTGGSEGSYEVILKINDVVEATKEVTVRAGASKGVTFKISEDAASIYSVNINGLSGSFVVKPVAIPAPAPTPTYTPSSAKPINWSVLSGVIAAVVVAGILIFLLARRRSY